MTPDPSAGYRIALIGTIGAAVIAAGSTVWIGLRTLASQRKIAYDAAKAEADAERSEAAVAATVGAFTALEHHNTQLAADNDRLRAIAKDWEGRYDAQASKLYEARAEVAQLGRERDDAVALAERLRLKLAHHEGTDT